MDFSDIFSYEKYLKELNEYRNDYIDYLEKKYVNADGPDFLIDMSTLEVLENEGESELTIPSFGYLNEYYCKPAQDLIKETREQLLREYPKQESPVKQKKLSKYAQDLMKEKKKQLLHEYPEQESPVKQKKLSKYDDKKMTHVSTKSRLEKICSKLERSTRQNITVDTSLQYPYKKCKKTKEVCSSKFQYQNLPIDDLSKSSKECKGNKTEPRQKINQNASKSAVSYEESKCETYFNCEGNMSSNSHTVKEVSEVENSCSSKYKAKDALHHTTCHNKIIKYYSEKRVTVRHKSLVIELEQTERYNKVKASTMPLTDSGFSKEKTENELDLSSETKSQKDEYFSNGTLSSLTYCPNLGNVTKRKKLYSENKQINSKNLLPLRITLNPLDLDCRGSNKFFL